jgi:hypothetical protein
LKKIRSLEKSGARATPVLFIFAGAAAEFALNKAVDWLYFTGDCLLIHWVGCSPPVRYARRIVFSPTDEA